jgi:GTP diphosphokinase / guanosine-3',5'-bis(diphosphate) 3'-diphosphatase
VKLQDVITAIQEYNPDADLSDLQKAYAYTREHHKGQTRASGEPYITHVTEVAYLVAKLKLDMSSVIAAMLHDVVEDTDATIENLEAEFGKDVAELVDGITKLSKIKFSSRAEAQAESFRKMLIAMARDIRILLIKLCDRLHNMRTLEYLAEPRRMRIAQESLDIYAPLAHRLGIHWMKSEIEDLSLRHLKPEVYQSIKAYVNEKQKERERYIKEVSRQILVELEQNNIKSDVSGRPKHFFSIYEKMETQGLHFQDIYDLIAFRVIVPTTMECYAAVGIVHAAWKPIPGRFKDYIAMPKPNGYQSLHTTIIGPLGKRVEVQIRTTEMHDIAERGIAAHWVYKEGREGKVKSSDKKKSELQLPWLKELVESGKIHSDPYEFMSVVKEDLYSSEVYVFSPRGDLIALSAGAGPIDFAYHIHSEVGDNCTGARVNGQQVPLSYKLQNGDTVEITTSPSQRPSKDWLSLVSTSKAKQKIRNWIKEEERGRSIAVGKELLVKDLRKFKLNYNTVVKDGSLEKIAIDMGLKDIDSVLAEIGYGKVTTNQVVANLLPDEQNVDQKLAQDESALQKIFNRAARVFRDQAGVKVSGLEDVVFRFAHCCEPLPGDDLVGYVTRGRGVAIHVRGCSQTLSYDSRRLIPVAWDKDAKAERKIKLDLVSEDKVGMLAEITKCISGEQVSIAAAQIASTEFGQARSTFEIRVDSSEQLARVIRALEKLPGIVRVDRVRKPLGKSEG